MPTPTLPSDTPKIIATSDGSHSLQSEHFGVAYHSTHGAIQESQHVFIEAGLRPFILAAQKEIKVLEMGFGSGLNAYLVALEAEKHPAIQFHYLGVELYPISSALAASLNYPLQLNRTASDSLFLRLHSASWEETQALLPNFSFQKLQADFQTAELPQDWANTLFFDAFAPTSQAELWEEAALQRAAATLAPGGHLVTYCAKGAVKRSLKGLGLEVQALPGPPGKREMTKASKAII